MKKRTLVQGLEVTRTRDGDVLVKGRHGGVPLEFEVPKDMGPKQVGGVIGSNLPGRHSSDYGLRRELRATSPGDHVVHTSEVPGTRKDAQASK